MDVEHQLLQKPVVHDRDAEKVQAAFSKFLTNYRENGADVAAEPKYENSIKQLEMVHRNTISVDFADIRAHDDNLAAHIKENYYRCYPYLCEAVRNNSNLEGKRQRGGTACDINIGFTRANEDKPKIRELRSKHIGTLVTITAQVTRTHSVHPELILGTFTCLDCQTPVRNVPQQFKYTQPTICKNPACGNKRRFRLDIESSAFVDYQRLRVQEIQEELPCGSTPRTLDIILRGECVETAQPGDKVELTGTLIVVPDVSKMSTPGSVSRPEQGARGGAASDADAGVRGLQSLGVRHMTYTLAFLATTVRPVNLRVGDGIAGRDPSTVSTAEVEKTFSEEQLTQIQMMKSDRDLMTNMCNSVFSTIIGNNEIKQGILLMLVGGVPKRTADGTRLRGDLNVLIVGDPSTAKSQFLRQVAAVMPRAVYASGQSTTAAGLTAAVVKDDETGEFVIEAGALMLGDNGVCCIDEFDKMDIKDQIAIHEAMEQQTISITKAGVKATLNARTSVLAAANPVHGTYDRSKPLRFNVAFSPAILSRFDLFFVLLDECDPIADYNIGREIVQMHATRGKASVANSPYTKEQIQLYIMFAKYFRPRMTKAAAEHLVSEYTRLRQRDSTGGQRVAWRVTVRQLESLIRLSEAYARLELADLVELRHAEMSCRLLNKSVVRVEQPEVCLMEGSGDDELPPTTIPADSNNSENLQMDPSASVIGSAKVGGTTSAEETASGTVSSKKVKLSMDEYRRISGMLSCQLRLIESRSDAEVALAAESGESAMEQEPTAGLWRRSQLLNWYLEQWMEALAGSVTEVQLVERKRIVAAVIAKLVQVRTLAELRVDSGDAAADADPIITINPNYSLPDAD